MKIIKLSNGMGVKIDDEDAPIIGKNKWFLGNSGYAQRRISSKSMIKKNGSTCVLMHRFILNVPKGKYTDHINGDKLDNRKSNLRICTNGQNACNSKIRSDNTSGFKGVHFCKQRKKFVAQITFNGKAFNLGRFYDLETAVKTREKFAKMYFKEFNK